MPTLRCSIKLEDFFHIWLQDSTLGGWCLPLFALDCDKTKQQNIQNSLRWDNPYGCFLKWWYPQNTPKWSFLVGKAMVVGYHHFKKHPYRYNNSWSYPMAKPFGPFGLPGFGESSNPGLDSLMHLSRYCAALRQSFPSGHRGCRKWRLNDKFHRIHRIHWDWYIDLATLTIQKSPPKCRVYIYT